MRRRVAVTGMGVASPIGVGVGAFFAGLDAGSCGIGRIGCFDARNLQIQIAGEVKTLDCGPSDRKVALALIAAGEAMQMAGEKSLAGALLDIGSSLELFHLTELCRQKIRPQWAELLRANASPTVRCPLDTAGRQLIDRYGAPRRFLNNVSACAVGVQTIGHAYRSIRDGDCDRALAGGFDSMINPLGVGGFQLLGALSERGCYPFDVNRSGLVLGEGAGMFYLEELELALAAGKTIYAEVCGYGATLDAYNLSAPPEDGEGAARAIRQALTEAQLTPGDVDLINAHGTGTPLNDPAEAAAVRRVFGDRAVEIPVVAVKSQIGHLIAAAGAVELVSCVYSLLRNRAPGNIGLGKVGRGCELNHVTDSRPWHGEVILSNSFGFGGQNGCLILRRFHG